MILALGGTTKCRNNSLVPPPHTDYEPLNSIPLIYRIWRRSWMVATVTLIRTTLPNWSHNCPMGFRPGLHAGQAKRSPGLLQTWTLPSTFSYTLPVFAQWHGVYPQVTSVACHCMDHGNNDHCDQCQNNFLNCETITGHRRLSSTPSHIVQCLHWWRFGTLQKGPPPHSWSCHSSHWNCTPMILGSWECWITRLP